MHNADSPVTIDRSQFIRNDRTEFGAARELDTKLAAKSATRGTALRADIGFGVGVVGAVAAILLYPKEPVTKKPGKARLTSAPVRLSASTSSRAPSAGVASWLLAVTKRSSDTAFRHDGMCFAEERFADDAHFHAGRCSFDRGAKARAAGPDHKDVVGILLVFEHA